jgi:hypothetical protein
MDRIYGLVGTEGAGSLQASLLRIQNAGWPKVPVPKRKREQTRANLLAFRSNLLAFRSMCLVLFVRRSPGWRSPEGVWFFSQSSRAGKERAAKPRNEKAIDVLKPTVPRNSDSAPAMISAIFAKEATSLVSGLRTIHVGFVGLGYVEAPKRNAQRKHPMACAFRGSPSPGFEGFGRKKVRERAAKLLESLGRVNLCALSVRANLEACLGERHEGRLRPKCLDPAPPCQSANRARLRSKFDDALKGEGSCARRRSWEADPDRAPPFAMKGAQFVR